MESTRNSESVNIAENIQEIPEIGDTVRTNKMQMTGKVERVEPHNGYLAVLFRTEDGRLMRAPVDNVTVIEKLEDGNMGGINRSAPAQDVSYEDILQEVMDKWEAEQLNELSVDTLKKYKKAATSRDNVRDRPLRKLAKSVVGVNRANGKIAAATGDRSGNNPKTGPVSKYHMSYQEKLSEFLDEDKDKDSEFERVLKAQHQDIKPGQTTDKEYNGWIIRYQLAPRVKGQPVQWMAWHSKKTPDTAKRGSAADPEHAFQDATAFINSGGDSSRVFKSSHVTIDFNVNFSRDIVPDGEGFFAKIDDGFLIVSLSPQEGFKKAHRRADTMGSERFWSITMSTKEAEMQKLVPNGRYMVGNKEEIDSGTSMFSIHFQSVAQDTRDKLRMNAPGFTVATTRSVDEECWDGYKQIGMKDKNGKQVPNCVPTDEAYMGPWQGDPVKYAKSPKSTMYGKGNITLSDLVRDSIDVHGLKYSFDYYVRKHGMPPRHFQIYAGLVAKPPKKSPQEPAKLPATDSEKPSKKPSWWQKIKSKMPFEE